MSYTYRPLTATQARRIVAEDPDERQKEATRIAYVNLEGIYKEIACAAIRKDHSLTQRMISSASDVLSIIQEDLERNGYEVTYTPPNDKEFILGSFTITW